MQTSFSRAKFYPFNDSDHSAQQYYSMLVVSFTCVVFYFIVLQMTCSNVLKYVIKQSRYKEFSVMNFYVIAIFVEFFRILMYGGLIWYLLPNN